jgi:ketosteroid isomerase-like protein
MHRADVDAWFERYMNAWKKYDRDEIAGLFTDDAEYRYYPYDKPVVGGQAIADSWMEEGRRDEPGSFDADYKCVAADGNTAVATGESIYYDKDGSVKEAFDNAFVMEFDDDGRCKKFTEYYVKRPEEGSQKQNV